MLATLKSKPNRSPDYSASNFQFDKPGTQDGKRASKQLHRANPVQAAIMPLTSLYFQRIFNR